MKAITKKYYAISSTGKSIIITDAPMTGKTCAGPIDKPLTGFDLIYKKYFQRKCSNLHPMENPYCRFDFLLISAQTSTVNGRQHTTNQDVIVEYKKRWVEVSKYPTAMMDLSKMIALKKACELLDGACIFVLEYTDAVIYFWLDKDYTDFQVETIIDPDNNKYTKEVVHLDIKNAVFVTA